MRAKKRDGFTLIELLIVIAVLGFLITGSVYAINIARKKSRDTIRLNDMAQIQKALSLYLNETGEFPMGDREAAGGWDTGGDGDFISELVEGGYINENVLDPVTNNDTGNYLYYRYWAGAKDCDIESGRFYVLGVRDMETVTSGKHPDNPGFKCPGSSWVGFEWVAGAFEN